MAAAKIRRVAQAQQRRTEKQQRRRLREKKAEAKRRPGRPKRKLYYAKSRFSLKRLRKLLNNIESVITVAMPDEPFTKDPARMYSYYRFRPIEIRLHADGTLKGGILTFTFAWIDWSFIRLPVAPFYQTSDEGGYLWDPVILFLLDLLRVLLHFSSRDKLLEELRNETSLGREIAACVGIDPSASSGQALDNPKDPAHKVPSEMAFTHFRNRLTNPVVYEAVFHIMVGFLRRLDLITFRVLAFDSMLVETWANFNGCQNAGQAGHGCEQCPLFKQCERVPYDLEAGVGHRRSKEDANQVEALYSYKVHSGVSFEVELGMEFPMVLLVTPGQVYDGQYFEALMDKLEDYHDRVKAVFHIADGHYDDFKNYIAARRRGAKPIFHYNKRNEKTDPQALDRRGYNEVGRPYAPCGVVMHPRGYDEQDRRLKFTCDKQCPARGEDCPFRANATGCVKNVPVAENSRLVLEIPRGTRRYKILFALRSSVERNNDYFADNGLARPKYHGLRNMQLNTFLTGIATLLRKLYDLVEEAGRQEADPERYPTLDLWNLPLEKAIRERWKHFHEEDELFAFPDG
jgi:hypothetical protein